MSKSFTVRTAPAVGEAWRCVDKHLAYTPGDEPVVMSEQEARKLYAECEDHAQLMVQDRKSVV